MFVLCVLWLGFGGLRLFDLMCLFALNLFSGVDCCIGLLVCWFGWVRCVC